MSQSNEYCKAEFDQMEISVMQTSNDCIQSLQSRLKDGFASQSLYAKCVMNPSDDVGLEPPLKVMLESRQTRSYNLQQLLHKHD